MSNVTENLGLSYGEVKDVGNNHHITSSTHLDEKHDGVVPVPSNTHEVSVSVEHTHSVTVGRVESALHDVDTEQAVDTRHELQSRHDNQSTVPPHTQQHPDDEASLQAAHEVHGQAPSDESHAGITSSVPPMPLTPASAESLVPYTSPTALNSGGLSVRRRGAERYHPTSVQLKTLMASFDDNPCPSVTTLNQLSSSINMPMHNLVLWFKNKRARSKKNSVRLPGQRRSYVKSGIYSRARRASASGTTSKTEQETLSHPHPPLATATAPAAPPAPSPSCHADNTPNEGVPEPEFVTAPHGFACSPPISTSSPSPSVVQIRPQAQLPSAKRHQTNFENTRDENKARSSTPNACRNWSSLKCLQVFTIFFNKHTSGRNPDQMKAAQAVATEFFMSEMQSGLTVSSFVQPIQTSMAILDNIISKRTKQGHPPLTSGPRSILGEFIVQIRSGEASLLDTEPAEL